jgi:hypothetical protein
MSKQKTHQENQERTYESDMAGLMSLRLIAAPDPKDDLSDDELTAFCQDPKHSPELIRHLIDFIKTI